MFDERELRYTPEPTVFYEVGQEVRIGFLEQPVITKVLHGGKAYEVQYIDKPKKNMTGVSSEPTVRFDVFYWYNIYPVKKIESHNLIQNKDLELNYSQKDIEGILCICYHFGCDRDPEYQRGDVWTVEDQEALIDSIFHHIDIGKFVFVRLPYTPDGFGYEILDGKQRLKALMDFFENRFTYKGLYFKDLSGDEKNHFKRYFVSYAELREPTREQKLKTFILLNTRGRVMTKEELIHVKDLYLEEIEKNK